MLRPSLWTRSRCGRCSSAMMTMHLVPWLTLVCWTEPRIGASWTLPVRGQRLLCMVHGFCSIRLHHGLRPSAGRGSKASVGIREARPEEDL